MGVMHDLDDVADGGGRKKIYLFTRKNSESTK
jgi:hypothetical protein